MDSQEKNSKEKDMAINEWCVEMIKFFQRNKKVFDAHWHLLEQDKKDNPQCYLPEK